MDAALLAEAYFFRAFDYFILVQTYGGVALDLGAGELKFNTSPIRTSVRNTVPEVYTKCIFPDLEKAVAALPDNPRLTGTATKNLARLYLSKAYLTYAWWLPILRQLAMPVRLRATSRRLSILPRQLSTIQVLMHCSPLSTM